MQEVVNRVNANKVNDNRFGNIRQQNVVMGLSMGGLCARFALANMTRNFPGTPTETRLLITHDSPHRGANVPLGLQYMIRMLGNVQLFGYNVFDIYPDYNDAIGLLNAPATQQLLLYSATTTNAFTANTFLDATYRPMVTFPAGGPQPTYRFIATANGNECANPLFSPGKTFINLGAGVSAGIYARFLFFKVPILSYKLAVAVEAYALPAAGATNKIARVYSENSLKLFGFINIFKQLYNNTAYAPGTHLAVDGVPGSNYPLLNVDALNQLTNLPIFKVNLYVSFPLGPFLGGYFGVYAYNAGVSYNFTFVPTASALDAAPYTTPVFSQKYVGGINPSYPSTSETFIAQETVQNNPSLTNNVHIRFTARNSQWLFNQMEGIANTLNCSGECAVTGLSISGNGTLCTTGTYCVSNIPATTQITWTATPSSIVSLTPVGNGSCVNVSRLSNGNLTLTARTACSTSVTKAVRVGIYSTSDYNITQYPSTVCNNGIVQVGMPWYYTPPAPNTTYNWYYGNGLTYISGQGTNVITLRYNSQGPFSTPWVMGRANNDCGQGPFQTINLSVNPNCYSSFAVSPNPSTDVINIEPNTDPAAKATLTKPAEIVQVELTDKMGIIRYRQKFGNPAPTATINVSSLPSDVYTLRIFDGQIWFTHKVIIQH
ncbi:MAG: T9SS type A sorting domain-containing protein [Niastella sp.]|nr:T9SS type A sorting domain-containing protein [Niastella sp.]